MNKQDRIYIRVSKEDKEKIKFAAENGGYNNISKYILDSALDTTRLIHERDERIVYNIALTPTLDYVINLDNEYIVGNNVFDSHSKTFNAGGRGIILSMLLNEFNVKNKVVHHSSGFAGQKIFDILCEHKLEQVVIKSSTDTRVNVNVSDGTKNFAFSESPERISEYSKLNLMKFIDENLIKDDLVIISGSFIEEDEKYILELLNILNKRKVKIYFNSANENLERIIKVSPPYFIALCPQNNKKIKTKKEIKEYMNSFVEMGVQQVSYILDSSYSFFANKDGAWMTNGNVEKQTSFVGQEDSYIAGLISNSDKDIESMIKWAAASLKCKSLETITTQYKKIVNFYHDIDISEL